MSKIKNIFITLLAAALLPAAAAAQGYPGGLISQPLANGTTVLLTPTGTWQLDDWSKETNIARHPLDGSVYMVGTFSNDGGSTERAFVRKISAAGAVLWTSTVTNATGGYSEFGRGVAISLDNLFVYALSVRDNSGNQEIVVTKYTPAGTEVGQSVYSEGWGNNAYDIVADASFAYVAGTHNNDIAIFRFPANGDPATVVPYDGGDSFNTAYAIAQNTDGYLALAGTVYDGRDYNNPDDKEYGNEIWVAQYKKSDMSLVWASTYTVADQPEWGYDEAHGVKIDNNENVYAAGFYYSYDSGSDIWLGKYDSLGNLVWARTKNGPSNNYDKGFGIALDAQNNIYVAGKMEAYNVGQGENVWVGKYTQSGTLAGELSTNRFAEAGYDVEVSSAMAFVGGAFDQEAGVLAVSQSLFGAPQQLMASPGWSPNSVNLYWNYEEGGVYDYKVQLATYAFAWGAGTELTGTDEVSPGESKQLEVNGLPVRLDHTAQPPVPGPNYYFKVRLSTDSWATYTQLNNTANAAPFAPYNWWNYTSRGQDSFWVFSNAMAPSSALVRDGSGNTYIAYGNNMGGMAMVKFGPYGEALWTSFYNLSDFNGRFVVNRMKMDGQGNIYVAGMVSDQMYPNTKSAWIAKFSPLGIKIWDDVRSDQAIEGQENNFSGLAFTSGNKVIAGGLTTEAGGDQAMLLVKYESAAMPAGQQALAVSTYPAAEGPEAIWGLAVDGSDNIFAGGYLSSINGSAMVYEQDSVILKFDASLAYQGSATFGTDSNDYVAGQDAVADLAFSGGYLYAAGQNSVDPSAATPSFWVAKINPADWSVVSSDTYNSTDQLDAAAYGLQLSGGYLYAVGYENRYYPPDGQRNMVLRKYDPADLAGGALWTKAVDGANQNENTLAYGMQVGADGYFYLAGVFNMWQGQGGGYEGYPGVARISEPQTGIAAAQGNKPSSVRLSWVSDSDLEAGTTFYVHYSTFDGVAFSSSAAQFSFYTENMMFNGDYLERLVPGLETGNGAPAPGVNPVDSPTYFFRLGYERPGDGAVTVVMNGAVEASTRAVANTPGAWDRMDRYPNGSLFVVNSAHGGRNPLARDAEGNIYTAGIIRPWGPNSAAAYVRKFSRTGVPVWTRFWSDQYEYSQPVINALALDGQGNLYAAGSAGSEGYTYYPIYREESASKKDALIIKYDAASGRMRWAKVYDLSEGGNDEINALVVGADGVFAAGATAITENNANAGVLKLDPADGSFLYARGEVPGRLYSLAYDPASDMIYAAGAADGLSFNPPPQGPAAPKRAPARASAPSVPARMKVFAAADLADQETDIVLSSGSLDEFYAVAVDTVNGAIYLAGAVDDGNSSQDAYLVKYSTEDLSTPVWERTYNSANQNADMFLGLALDSSGGVYASGEEYRYDINQAKNLFVRKYNAGGELLWTQTLNSGGSNEDSAGGIAVDAIGGVYAAMDAGIDMAGAYNYGPTAINGSGFFKHTQLNLLTTNPKLTVRVNSAPNVGIEGVTVAVMGFSQTGGIDPNGINMNVTNSSGAYTFSLPGGKSYFVAVSSHNMVPTIKDQLSDPGGNFFVDLNADATRQYFISPRAATADPVSRMSITFSTNTGTLAQNDFVMAEVFITQTGERVGYSVVRATDVHNTLEVYNLPAAANGVYGMAVSVPARNKVLQLFMNGAFPAVNTYAADMTAASQLTGSFEVGASTVPPSVAGMVLDTNWSPLEGARVRLERSECAAWSGSICTGMWTQVYSKETFSDAGGGFSFYNVPFSTNSYNLNVSKPGYESGYRGIPLPPGTPLPYMGDPMNPGMNTTFELAPATYTLTGILKYNGVPLPNATIMVFPDWMSYSYDNPSSSDTYRQGQWGNGMGIRSDARVRTAADGSFTVNGITDGNARIEAAFEGGWRSLNEGNSYETQSDNLRVVISSSSSRGPGVPANNACRPGRVWVINSSGSCVTAGSVAFNIVPEGGNSLGRMWGNVTFVTTFTVSGSNPLVISTSSPITIMAQARCDGDCKNQQMGFTSLAGTFLSNTTGYSITLSSGVTYYPRVFSTAWAKASSYESEINLSSTDTFRYDLSLVRAGALQGVVKMPDGTNFKPVWGPEDSPTAYSAEINVEGVNVDVYEGKQTDEYGEFEFPNLSPGAYNLSIRPRGRGFVWAPVTQQVVVAEGRTTSVNLQLELGLAVQPQIFGLPEISTPTWGYIIVGVESGTEMNQKKITELFFSKQEFAFEYSTSTGWSTKYMPAGQYDFYLLLASRYEPGGDDPGMVSYQQFGNFIGRVKGVAVQKSDTNPNIGTAAQPIAVNILGSVGQAGIAGTVQGANLFTDTDFDRMFANFEETFNVIPAVMLYDSAGDLKGFTNAMPGSEADFQAFETGLVSQDREAMRTYMAGHPMTYGVWGLPPGRYTAVFNNPNYPPVAKEILDINSPAADITAFDFDAEEVVTAGISGVVLSSATGEALEGARVFLKHRTVEKFALTNSSGIFTFSNLPTGIYRLEVTRNGYVTAGEKTSLAANDSKSFTLRMLPSESKITGRVFLSKFPTQVTKAGVDIVAYDETENVNNPSAYLPKTEVQTDASGNFEVTGVVPGHDYKLSVFYTGKMAEVFDITAEDGNTVMSDITLKDIPPQITIKVRKSADSVNKVDVVIKSPKALIAAPTCRYNPGQAFDSANAVSLALVPGPNRTYLGQFTVSSSQQYYTVKVVAGDAGNKMEKLFVYDQESNAKTEQYIQQESLAGGAVQMDKESEEYSGIELDPGALSYSTAATTTDYSNLVGGFFSALPSVRTVKTDKGNLTISQAVQNLMASEVYNMDLSNAQANKTFTLTLKYDKERGAANAQNLRIYQQDADGNWVEVPGNYTIDPMLGVLSVDIASLTSAYEGTGGATTPLGRKRAGMSAVRNGRYVPSAAGTSQTGRFAVFTANPPTGTAAYSSSYEVYNLPNPFNLKRKNVDLSTDIGASGIADPYPTDGTVIKYNLPAGKSGRVKFVIYNLAGEKVRSIDEGTRTGGQIYYSEWDGKNDTNQDCASGVYFMLTYVDGKKLGKAHKMAIVK